MLKIHTVLFFLSTRHSFGFPGWAAVIEQSPAAAVASVAPRLKASQAGASAGHVNRTRQMLENRGRGLSARIRSMRTPSPGRGFSCPPQDSYRERGKGRGGATDCKVQQTTAVFQRCNRVLLLSNGFYGHVLDMGLLGDS